MSVSYPGPGQRYLEANPDVAANEKYGDNPRGHYEDWGKKEGRKWDDTPVSYEQRIEEAIYYETGRVPTEEELRIVKEAVDEDPSLLNTWYEDRQRKGLNVPDTWGEGGWNPKSLVPQADHNEKMQTDIHKFMDEDFEINLDPEGKWKAFEDAVMKDARQGYDPEQWASRAATDVKTAHKGQEAAIRRDAGRMGLNPNSGVFANAYDQSGLGVARDQAGAMTQARMAADELNRDRQLGLAQYGQQAQKMNMDKQLAEHGSRFERLGLGTDWAKHKDATDLGWGRVGLGFHEVDNRSKMAKDAAKAQGESDLWAGGATLGAGLLSNAGGKDGWVSGLKSLWG